MTESTLLQLESIHERFPMISEEEKKVDVNLAIQLQSSSRNIASSNPATYYLCLAADFFPTSKNGTKQESQFSMVTLHFERR